MLKKRPAHEDRYVARLLAPTLRRLVRSENLRRQFVLFAIKEGLADPLRFPKRLEHVLAGRPPTAYTMALLLVYGRWLKRPRHSTRKKR